MIKKSAVTCVRETHESGGAMSYNTRTNASPADSKVFTRCYIHVTVLYRNRFLIK